MFNLLFRFILLCAGIGSARAASHGDLQAAVMLLLIVLLWNWRWVMAYVIERWRY